MNKAYDSYEQFFTEESELIADVIDTAQNSEWISKIPSCAITVAGMDGPLTAEIMRETQYPYLDAEVVQETAECGSGLLMSYGGEYLPVRQSAIPTLQSTLRIGGLALAKMSPVLAGECYNNAATVAEGTTLCLVRYGKISACHSDANGGYAIMPIPDLLNITRDVCGKKFGEMRFVGGYNSHESTYAEWELPDAQGELLDLYRDAVDSAQNGSSHYVFNFMPAFKFISSDTASFCATLKPVFIDPLNGREIGGSDSAVIQGVSHWKCERHLYHDKIGTPMKNEAKAVFARGHILEDTVISTFCRYTGATRIRDTRMFRSVKYPHCIADIDAILRMPDDSIYLFEAKTTIAENRAAWANNNIPSYYLWQTRHYPAVLDDERVKGTFIGCLFTVDYQLGDTYIGSQFSPERKGFVSRLVERDADMEDYILSHDEEWWNEHITMSVEPEISADEEKEMSFLKSVSGDADTSLPPLDLGSHLDIGQRYLEVAAEIKLLKKQIENKETELSLYKMQFIDELGENVEGRIPLNEDLYIEVKYAPKKKTTVDTELLESIYPRAYAACVTIDPCGSRVFSLREKKIKPEKGKKVS